MTSPNQHFPDGGFGSPTSAQPVGNMQDITEQSAKDSMKAGAVGSWSQAQGGFWGLMGSILGTVVGFVSEVVNGVIGAVQGIFDGIASLFSASSVDTAAVDAARVSAENAIVAQMADSLDMMDEIQRAGGAFMNYPMFYVNAGENYPYILPLSAGMDLQAGTRFVGPSDPLTHNHGGVYSHSNESRARLATGSGYLELTEGGFWRIDFQAAMLQGPWGYADPAHLWCYITPASSPYIPYGAPGLNVSGSSISGVMARHRVTGDYVMQPATGFIRGYGRASSYVDQLESNFGGGNTVSGSLFALLPAGAWKVTLSSMCHKRFSGAASTFVYATNINSDSLRDDIEGLKDAFESALPGAYAPKTLTQSSINALSSEASAVTIPPIAPPTVDDL